MRLTRRPVRFRHLERSDFALLADWFARDHVAPWWREPADLPAIEARYGPTIDGPDATEVFIVELDRRPIGLIQRYLVDDDPAWSAALAPANAPRPAAGIDYLIGEQSLTGHGLGPRIIDRFLTDTWRRYPAVVAVLVAVQQTNGRSWRALEKSGFHRIWAGVLTSDDPSDRGPSYLYQRARPRPPATAPYERDETTLSSMVTSRTDAGTPASDEKAAQPSALGLIILWQLVAAPNHAYGLQKLFTSQGKDRVVNLQSRANLQQAIKRLQRLGLVEVRETVRGVGYPDRIVYAITDSGRQATRVWLREMLAETAGEYPDFIAAVSILFGLDPDDARVQLERRAVRLADALTDTNAQLQGNPDLPRLFLLEEEYRRTILTAQLSWLHAVIDDLQTGRLTWNEEWLAELFAAYHPQEPENELGD